MPQDSHTELKALYDDQYVVQLAQTKTPTQYRFEVCHVDSLGAAKDSSCINAFKSANGEEVTFSFESLYLDPPSSEEQRYFARVQEAYQRMRRSQKHALLYRGSGIAAVVLATVYTINTKLAGLTPQKAIPAILGLLVIWNGGIALLKADGTATERATHAEKILKRQESRVTLEYLQQFHRLEVLLEHWDTLASEDPNDSRKIDSVRHLVEDLARYLHELEWIQPGKRIDSFCFPETISVKCRKLSQVHPHTPSSQ